VTIFLRRANADIDAEKLASAVLHPEGCTTKLNHLIRMGNVSNGVDTELCTGNCGNHFCR
jgi:hypothetical protein